MKLKVKPIDGWQRAWRLDSVRAAGLLALVSVLQLEVLPLFEAQIPADWWPYISAAFAVVIALLRLRAQPDALTPPERRVGPPEATE